MCSPFVIPNQDGILTTVAFVTGAATSMIAGYVGMKVAVFSNARTTKVSNACVG